MQITLTIDNKVAAAYPGIQVLGFLVTNIESMDINESLPDCSTRLTTQPALQDVAADPHIVEWRTAYKKMGLKPSTYRSSVEQLMRRKLRGNEVATPVPLVNVYCAVSLAKLAPIGGYDVDRLPTPNVEIRFGNPTADVFDPLGGSAERTPVSQDVVVYASGSETMCWAFNHRDSKHTALRLETARALFLSEGLCDVHYLASNAAMVQLQKTLSQHGAKAGPIASVSADLPIVALEEG